MIAAAEIVMTSLKMPQIESVTTEDRFRRLAEQISIQGMGASSGMCNARKLAANHQECYHSWENNNGEGDEKPLFVDKLTVSLE